MLQQLAQYVRTLFDSRWTRRNGLVVPADTDIGLGNDAVELDATVLYADLSDSTILVDQKADWFAAAMYKAFQHCAAKLIRESAGVITAYDGDRVMAVFIGDDKEFRATRAALSIHYAVLGLIRPEKSSRWPGDDYVLKHVVGIDSSRLFVARTGIRGANDLVWVGRAANHAAKLASSPDGYATYITAQVFDRLPQSWKVVDNRFVWERWYCSALGYDVYRSAWHFVFNWNSLRMLTKQQETQVSEAVERGLDRAEATWKKVGSQLITKSAMVFDHAMESFNGKPSSIPGHPWVSDDSPTVDEFVALVIDMRNSSEHLKSRRPSSKVEFGFQRVYYETSALLPAVSVTCGFHSGVVTEYLGDGALILFRVNPENKVETIRRGYRAARDCVDQSRDIVNGHLAKRFNLPEVHIGAGLALSKALVSLVGDDQDSQPKAIGECVWEATKLSGGTNTVHVSESLKGAWPSSKGGKLQFVKTTIKSVPGYRVASG